MAQDWHLFCRVVDNFGDIGVCWQLARQLHRAHGLQITLWVDDLQAASALWPAIAPNAADQQVAGVRLRHWCEPFPAVTPGQVVIEAFGCHLPDSYIAAMARHRPLWLNLEYLSAEPWVEDCHLSQSPVHGLRKTFFFPGFSAHTGGLLWEPELLALADSPAPGALQPMLDQDQPSAVRVSLFAYENPALPALLTGFSRQPHPVQLLVPAGRILPGVEAWAGAPLQPGRPVQRGALQLQALPFLNQDDYDRLLALCDLNFVRGEASFVRSQMLARPFIWHIYPQADRAHLDKLSAFLDRYLAGADRALQQTLRAAHQHWNDGVQPLPDLLSQLPAWRAHAQAWQRQMVALGNLSANIVHFCSNQV